MNNQETPKSLENDLDPKSEKLKKAINLMLDFKKSDLFKQYLEPNLHLFDSDQLDYCLLLVQYADNMMQLRGPLAAAAKERKIELEAALKELEVKIGAEATEAFKSLIE